MAGHPRGDPLRPRKDTGDILARIRDLEPRLSRAQTKIARAIFTYPALFVERPIEELGPWIGVSAPTITRFCRTVGCEGLRDLKLRVMGSMRVGPRYLSPQDPPETFEAVREQALMRAQNALTIAGGMLEEDAIDRALDALLSAGTVYAFGGGGVSSWLIDEFQNRFFRLGVRVIPSSDALMHTMLAATLDRGDVVVCFSLGGVSPDLVETARIAADYGATTIAITPPGSDLADNVDIALGVWVPDEGDVLGPTAMRYAVMIAVDVLAFAAAVRTRPKAMEKLRRIKQQFVAHLDDKISRPLCD